LEQLLLSSTVLNLKVPAMLSTLQLQNDANHDPLTRYVAQVQGLPAKFAQISANQHDSAASLGRAAAALRALAAYSQSRLRSDSGN
jgi:hypothetical protein